MKKPIVTLEQVKEIEKTYPTPFHIYDEKAIRENARALKEAFSWNKGYREYFAVKATPNPFILKILQEDGHHGQPRRCQIRIYQRTAYRGIQKTDETWSKAFWNSCFYRKQHRVQ